MSGKVSSRYHDLWEMVTKLSINTRDKVCHSPESALKEKTVNLGLDRHFYLIFQ